MVRHISSQELLIATATSIHACIRVILNVILNMNQLSRLAHNVCYIYQDRIHQIVAVSLAYTFSLMHLHKNGSNGVR
jgi:hypothetical protein